MGLPSDEQIGEIPLDLKADLDPELVKQFISDAHEQLENIEQGTLALEKNAQDPEVIRTLFRAFHTLKGNAGFLDLTAISQLAHALESLLDEMREDRLDGSAAVIELILKSRDTLQEFVDEIEAQISGKKTRQIVHIPTAALKVAARQMANGNSASITANAQTAETAKAQNESTPENPVPAGETPRHAVKVSTSKLDGLVDLTGELLIAQSLLAQTVSSAGAGDHPALRHNLEQLSRIGKELHRLAMSMRMVPIGVTFQKLPRLVRHLAAQQKKNVRLVLEGDDTEVDRTIVEKLADPLMHMIRNAVDHAIESPEQRAARGKPPMGTILLRAYHRSGNIIIEVIDDGSGLDRKQIVETAIEQGLLPTGAALDDKDLFSLIMRPGFSTATTVTTISGRGVGLDVVQKNISQLRGRIDVKSTPGDGTTFTLRLPLTLAIIDGLIIRVGGRRYILPAIAVQESLHPRSRTIAKLPGGAEVAHWRREVIPLLRLRDHFQLEESREEKDAGILIVIESDGKKRCLVADELIGKQEVVVKNLGEVLITDPMVAGGAILSDGCVGLILDAAALVHLEPVGEEPRRKAA